MTEIEEGARPKAAPIFELLSLYSRPTVSILSFYQK